jgi:hypothetical protein
VVRLLLPQVAPAIDMAQARWVGERSGTIWPEVTWRDLTFDWGGVHARWVVGWCVVCDSGAVAGCPVRW